MPQKFLSVENLTQQFQTEDPEGLTVFEDINFKVNKGEFVSIIGHSGCGKSTILSVLAGLGEATSGVVIMEGREISGPSLDRGVVFQNYSLLPWLSTLKNVTFGVASRYPTWSAEKVQEHALSYLELVGLKGEVVNRKPSQLSGGMRQRVSIARAFATQPKLLLLDEPFGALDALTRGTIQDELLKIWAGTNQTIFMITHDVDEAIYLSDRILLMSNGPYAQVAESVEIEIDRPRSRSTIVEHPIYYDIRNHLVHFLTERSAEFSGKREPNSGKRYPIDVRLSEKNAVTKNIKLTAN